MRKGIIALVPNKAINEGRDGSDFMRRWIILNKEFLEKYKIIPNIKDTYLQVWIKGNEGPYPGWLPKYLFENKKEGDIIHVGDLELEINQFWYKNFGGFIDILNMVE